MTITDTRTAPAPSATTWTAPMSRSSSISRRVAYFRFIDQWRTSGDFEDLEFH